MDNLARPCRSVLYIPGSNARALEKARTLPADAIIFDLEDAVVHDAKLEARALLCETLSAGGYGARLRIVRLNGMDTEWGAADLAAVAQVVPDAILLPKVGTAAEVEAVAARLDAMPACADTAIWAMMETARGIVNAAAIAQAPRMGGLVMGTNDLAKELLTRFRPDRAPLLLALQMCLLAARAEGLACVDGVYNAFRDEDGLRAECDQGRDMGFDGKSLIHPAQIAIANECFAPSQAEIDLAQRHIAAFHEAEAEGRAVAVVDGKIVENLHIVTARQTLSKAQAIRELERVA